MTTHRTPTKKLGQQLAAILELGAALDRALDTGLEVLAGDGSRGRPKAWRDLVSLEEGDILSEVLERFAEVFADVGGHIVEGGGGDKIDDAARERINATFKSAGWGAVELSYAWDVINDSVTDGCFVAGTGLPAEKICGPGGNCGGCGKCSAPTTDTPPSPAMAKVLTALNEAAGGYSPHGEPMNMDAPIALTLKEAELCREALELQRQITGDVAESDAERASVIDLIDTLDLKLERLADPDAYRARWNENFANGRVAAEQGCADSPMTVTDAVAVERGDIAEAFVAGFNAWLGETNEKIAKLGLRRLEQGDDTDAIITVEGIECVEIEPAHTVQLAGPGAPPMPAIPTNLAEVAAAVAGPFGTVASVLVAPSGQLFAEVIAPAEESRWACADCGTDAVTSGQCRACRSIRVILTSVLRATLGAGWREAFAGRTGAVTDPPLPYEAEPTVLRGPGGIVLTLDVREANPEDPGAGTPALVGAGSFSASFECASTEGELTAPSGETRPLEDDQIRWLDQQQRHVDELWRQAAERLAVKKARAEHRAEQICGALPCFDGAGPCEKTRGHEDVHAAKGKRWGQNEGQHRTEQRTEMLALADGDPALVAIIDQHLPPIEPTSSACKLQIWCNLQVGHAGPCLPTMMRDGSF